MSKKTKDDSRHRASDRRNREAQRDILGYINEGAYKGPDRRSGVDRRALYRQMQKRKVRAAQTKFIIRSIAGSSVAVMAIVVVSFFLLMPEYSNWDKFIHSLSAVTDKATESIPENVSIGALVNRKIKEIEDGTTQARQLYNTINFSNGERSVNDLSHMLDRIHYMQQSTDGRAVVEHSLTNLRAVIHQTADDPERLRNVIQAAQKYDSTLNKMLGDVNSKDIAAAAMLLALNQFRSNVYNGRPYSQDIALLKKLAGNDPEMNAAIDQLEPFAKKGAISQEALQEQLEGLARDIVLAKVRGEDVDVRQKAMARFDHYVSTTKASDIQGEEDAAVVARAQKFLDRGDVKSAVAELKKLEGSSAEAAQPWMQNAETNVMVGQSSDAIMQGIIGSMAGGNPAASSGVQSLMRNIKSNLGGNSGAVYLSPSLR